MILNIILKIAFAPLYYIACGLAFYLSEFDNIPNWVEKFHLKIPVSVFLVIFWLPFIGITRIVDYIDTLIFNYKNKFHYGK